MLITFLLKLFILKLFNNINYTKIVLISIHPVSITRFPLGRFSPGARLLRNPFVHRQRLRFSRGWVRKDGNLLGETGCEWIGDAAAGACRRHGDGALQRQRPGGRPGIATVKYSVHCINQQLHE